jgi:hypothetical protein
MDEAQQTPKSEEKVTASWVVNQGLREMVAQHAKMEDRSESSLIRQILREHFSKFRYSTSPPAFPYMRTDVGA